MLKGIDDWFNKNGIAILETIRNVIFAIINVIYSVFKGIW